MPTECTRIKTGAQVDPGSDGTVPDRHSHLCLFSVTTANTVWTFCGDTLDDMRAWQLALEQARLLIVPPTLASRPMYNCFGAAPSDNMLRQSTYYSPFSHVPATYVPALATGPYTFYSPALDSNQYPVMGQSSRSMPYATELQYLSPAPLPAPTALEPPLMYTDRHHHYTHVPQIQYPGPDGRDVAMGMLAGAAVGTVMWGSPYLWW